MNLDEIVGIQYITRELFDSGGLRLWSVFHDTCESAFRESLLETGSDMETSLRVALKYAPRGACRIIQTMTEKINRTR